MAVTIILFVVICLLGYSIYNNWKENSKKKLTINEQLETINKYKKEAQEEPAPAKSAVEEKPCEIVTIKEIDNEELKALHAKLNTELQSLAESAGEKKSYKSKIENLIQILNSKDRKEQEKMDNDMDDVLSGSFISTVEKAFPQLTKNDIALIGYILSGKSTKEIAALTNKEIRSVESSRNRLRKKLELESGEDLKAYFSLKLSEK